MIPRFYQRVLGEPLNEGGVLFIKNLSISTSSGFIASILFFVANVLAGRWLGPQEYGRYALILTYAQLLLIPMMLGLDTATVKYLAQSTQKPKLVGSSLVTVLCAIALTAIIGSAAGFLIGPYLHFTFAAALVTIVFGACLTLKTYSDAIARGFQWFAAQGLARIIEATVVLVSFILLVQFGQKPSALYYISSLVIGMLFFTIIIGSKIKRYIDRPEPSLIKQLVLYGIWAVVGGLAGYLLLNIHRVLLDRLTSIEAVGIYSAYLAASLTISSQLLSYFINVFFPTAAGLKNRTSLIAKLRRFELLFAPCYFVAMIGIVSLVIILFGRAYPFSWPLIMLFALVAVFHALYSIEMWLANAEGLRGVRSTIIAAILFGVANTITGYFLIKQFGIIGAAITTIIIFALFFVYLTQLNKKLH